MIVLIKKIINNTKEELGDVMLHLVFQAQILNEKASYKINDVLENINTKLIDRHPHVFNKSSHSAKIAKINWESQKHLEKKRIKVRWGSKYFTINYFFAKNSRKSFLAGFDWDNIEDVWLKIDEEINELKLHRRK